MALNMEKWQAMGNQAFAFLSLLVAMSSTPWHAKMLGFVKMVWNSPEFQAFWKQTPAATGGEDGEVTMPVMSLEAPSPEAQALFDRYKATVGEQSAGNISEFLTLLFEFVAWFKAFQAKRQPAAPAGS